MTGKVLEGIRVVEMATYIAGPGGAKILSDLGAEVIKIENANHGLGNPERFAGAPHISFENEKGAGQVGSFMQTLCAGKKDVTFNMKSPEGKNLFYELIKTADVFIDNHPFGSSERMGIDYDTLKQIKPDIIVVRVTGYGITESKYRDWLAFDPLFEGLTGFMSLTGEPGSNPTKAGTAVGDCAGQAWVALAAMSALMYRERTGKGQQVDYAMVDGMMTLMENQLNTMTFKKKMMGAEATAPAKGGNRHPNVGPFNTFQCGDGKWIFIVCGNNAQSYRLFDVIGHPELKELPENATQNGIAANYEVNEPCIREYCAKHTAEEVVDELVANSVAVGPIYDMADVYADPYFRQRGMLIELDDPNIGTVEIQGSPLAHMSESPAVTLHTSPMLGEHNKHVVCDILGKTDEEYESLVAANAFGM